MPEPRRVPAQKRAPGALAVTRSAGQVPAARLHDHDAGNTDREEQLARLDVVIERIDTKITDLRITRRAIRETIEACRSGNCRLKPVGPDGVCLAGADVRRGGAGRRPCRNGP